MDELGVLAVYCVFERVGVRSCSTGDLDPVSCTENQVSRKAKHWTYVFCFPARHRIQVSP